MSGRVSFALFRDSCLTFARGCVSNADVGSGWCARHAFHGGGGSGRGRGRSSRGRGRSVVGGSGIGMIKFIEIIANVIEIEIVSWEMVINESEDKLIHFFSIKNIVLKDKNKKGSNFFEIKKKRIKIIIIILNSR